MKIFKPGLDFMHVKLSFTNKKMRHDGSMETIFETLKNLRDRSHALP